MMEKLLTKHQIPPSLPADASIPLSAPLCAAAKRLFDILFSLLAILLFSPLMLAVAVAVRCTTGESPIFRQERVGLHGRPFVLYKFRTMRAGSPDSAWTRRQDPRRTPLGVFLRRFSLDELPQFFNVLSGSMSVVGPRPEIPFYASRFSGRIPRYAARHRVKPGITGWAQVHRLRGDSSIEARAACDLHYIENWRPLLDLQIILRTIFYAFYNPYE